MTNQHENIMNWILSKLISTWELGWTHALNKGKCLNSLWSVDLFFADYKTLQWDFVSSRS